MDRKTTLELFRKKGVVSAGSTDGGMFVANKYSNVKKALGLD